MSSMHGRALIALMMASCLRTAAAVSVPAFVSAPAAASLGSRWSRAMVTTRCKDPSWVLHQWRLRPRKRGARRMAADEAAGEDVEESSMLLEAKRQISHIGDVANIAMFVKMLKIAKEALVGALRSSTGKPSGISENLVMELSLVNPLSEPARDELLAREYEYVSTHAGPIPCETGDKIEFRLEQPGAASEDGVPTNKKPKEQGGTVVFAAQGGGVRRGWWSSVGPDVLQLTWEGGEPTCIDASVSVLYLDNDMLILKVDARAHVLQLLARKSRK